MRGPMAGRREANLATARETEGGLYELGDLLSCLFFRRISAECGVLVFGRISSAPARPLAPAVSRALPWRAFSFWHRQKWSRYSLLQHGHHDDLPVLVWGDGLPAYALLHHLVFSGASRLDHDRAGRGEHHLLVSGEGVAAL